MDVSIIIVSYNTKDLLKRCLSSIFNLTKGVSFEVIVVDNASSDDSVEYVKDQRSKIKNLFLIENSKNLGFGRANNQGAKIAKGHYIFIFNSDAYLKGNALPGLVSFMDKNPKIGVLGPLILNPDGSIQQTVGFFPDLPQVFYWMSFLDDLPTGDILKPYHVDHDRFYKSERAVDWVTGAAMFIRSEAIEKSGGFDENIFLYGEDMELCYRIKGAGYKIKFSPVASVIHLGQGSLERAQIGAIVGEYKAILYFYQKYKNNTQIQILKLLLKFGALLRILIFGIIQGRKELQRAYIRAFTLV